MLPRLTLDRVELTAQLGRSTPIPQAALPQLARAWPNGSGRSSTT
ncbi:hypothetical protein [Deinococcus hopiensis]|nr:hypothetical protein [Deinococcus hopiensis]